MKKLTIIILFSLAFSFSTYADTDGKIDHLEYIKMNKPAKGGGGVSGIMDRVFRYRHIPNTNCISQT